MLECAWCLCDPQPAPWLPNVAVTIVSGSAACREHARALVGLPAPAQDSPG